MSDTKQVEKLREIVDSIRMHGKQLSNNGEGDVRDLPGAGRLTTTGEGFRRDFRIEASGFKLEIGSWRGHLEIPNLIEGDGEDIDRVLGNARQIREIVEKENQVARRAEVKKLTVSAPRP